MHNSPDWTRARTFICKIENLFAEITERGTKEEKMESRDVASQPIDPLILALSFLGNRNSARKRSVLEKLVLWFLRPRMGKKLENLVVNIGRGPKRWGNIIWIEIVEERGNRNKRWNGVWHFGPRNIRGRKWILSREEKVEKERVTWEEAVNCGK